MEKIAAAASSASAARAKNTPRQPATGRIQPSGVVAVSAPRPPAAITAALSEAWRSAGNHSEKALNEAIRQAETPRPISARAVASPTRLLPSAKKALPAAAISSSAASTRRGP